MERLFHSVQEQVRVCIIDKKYCDTMLTPLSVLAVLGLAFVVGLIIVTFIYQDDPLDDLVVEYTEKYDLKA
jgi:hypothetical protein